jgi:hypothetical protein
MSAIEDYSQHKATRDRWEIWFRKRLGNDDKRIQAAVDAAMRKALNGASSQDAALAGIAAAAAVLPDVTTSSTSGHHPPDIPPNLESMQSGTIVGHARNVRQQSQLSGGGSIITLDFRLESPNSPVIQVQMRGPLLSGAIKDGDVVEVQCADTRDGLVHTDYVYNRSTNSEVRMRKGFSGVAGTLEARWGGQAMETPAHRHRSRRRNLRDDRCRHIYRGRRHGHADRIRHEKQHAKPARVDLRTSQENG